MDYSKLHLLLLPLPALVSTAYAQDYLTAAQVRAVLFPAADVFDDHPLTLSSEQKDKIKELAGVRQRDKLPTVMTARKKGKLLGWVMIDEVVGKHEFITYAASVSPDGKLGKVEILSYRETHGGQIRNEDWRKRFEGKSLADPFKLDVDIPNITGATLSCRNVMDGLKRLLAIHRTVLSERPL